MNAQKRAYVRELLVERAKRVLRVVRARKRAIAHYALAQREHEVRQPARRTGFRLRRRARPDVRPGRRFCKISENFRKIRNIRP